MEEEQVRALRFYGDFNFFVVGWNHYKTTNNLTSYSISNDGKLNKNFQKEILTKIEGDQISDFQVIGDFVYTTTTNGSLLKLKIFNTPENSNDSFQVVNTNSEIPSIATSDSRELLSFGCKNGKIFVFNTLQDSQIRSISESSSINDVLFQDRNILITASNKFVSLWDLRTTSDVIKTQNKKNIEYSCVCELNKTLIFAGSTSGHLSIFDQRNLLTPIAQESPLHSRTIWDMKFHDYSLYSIGDDGFIVKTDFSSLINAKDSNHITTNFEFLENISTPINAFDINSNSKILAYATEEETLNVLSI